MSETISSGITLTIPTSGQTNWATIMHNCFQKISEHDHSGSGNGVPIGTEGIEANAITDNEILLHNAGWLRARNVGGVSDVNILRVNASDVLVIGTNEKLKIGDGYLELLNATAPGTPTAAGRLYVVSGALTYKGSSGTVTTLGNA